MNSLSSIYSSIESDFKLPQYSGKTSLSRTKKLACGNSIYFILDADYTRQVALELSSAMSPNKFPSWRGLQISVASYFGEELLVFKKLPKCEAYIYDIVMSDLVDNIENATMQNLMPMIINILEKWKQFFLLHSEFVLSEIQQQGLFTELQTLSKLIASKGPQAVAYWTGCEKETHDFYINGCAVEVKSTASKAPYIISISSEYQLDSHDVSNGILYLEVYALKRSKADGESLPVIVDDICGKLSDSSENLQLFREKLLKYGYVDAHPELYIWRFTIRDRVVYCIRDGFPRIISGDIPSGVGTVTYLLDLAACDKYKEQAFSVENIY